MLTMARDSKGKLLVQRVLIKNLHIEGSAKLDMESENVKAIAESIEQGGLLQPSLVVRKDGKIVCGRDRVLAQMRLKRDTALVIYVTGTEQDIALARLNENLCRRSDDKDALRAKRVQLLQEAIKAEKPDLNCAQGHEAGKTKRGRPSSGKAEAIAAAALEEGVSPATVKDSISRAKKKAGEPAPNPEDEVPEEKEPAVPAPKISCLRTLGLEVPDTVEDTAAKEQKLIDRMARDLQDFGAALTAHREARAGLDAADDRMFAEWEEQRKTMAFAIRASRPACLCPHCKPHVVDGTLYAEAMATCLGCRGRGFISEQKLENVEKALLDEGDEAGIWVPEKGKRPQWRTLISIRGEDFA